MSTEPNPFREASSDYWTSNVTPEMVAGAAALMGVPFIGPAAATFLIFGGALCIEYC